MKILLIATTPFVIEKGSSLRVFFMAKTLANAGHKVDVLTYPVGNTPKIKNLRVIRVKSGYNRTGAGPSLAKTFLNLKILSEAKKLLKKNRYDVVQGEDTEAGFIACLLRGDHKLVYDMHNRMSEQLVLHKWYPLVPLAYGVEKVLFSRPDLIITNWKRVQKQLGNRSKPAVLIYDSVTLEKSPLKFKLPQKYIVYTGNFEHYQGVDLLVEAYWKSNTSLALILVGPHSKKTLLRPGKKGMIKFLGRLSVNETNYVISNSEFCVIPRVHGKQPSMKIIHYLLNKKSVLATDIECNQEILNKQNTLFVSPDTDSIANGIKKLSSSRLQTQLEKGIAKSLPSILPTAQEKKLIQAYKNLIK
ncbi:MAG: glycosyltransferase [Nanoarchaeota archaeon]|nr:glycosyltransferase [Nanoarchaeota archaeon]